MATMISLPETAAPDEIVDVRILIRHPMETGFRREMDGRAIPRNIISTLRCLYLGQEVFRAEFFPAVAANPFLGFTFRATESGTVELVWGDDSGGEWRETREIAVA